MIVPSAFDWDEGNLTKCQMHGVSIGEVEALFMSDPFIGRDERHSEQEDRYVAVGPNSSGRSLLVIYTVRVRGGVERVRPVSARYMHQKEIRWYEEEAAKDHN
jgi:uncharacterized DUF497 family protein